MPIPWFMNPWQVKTDQALQFFKVNVSFSQAFLCHAIKNPFTSRPWSKSVFSNKQKIAMEELRAGPKQKKRHLTHLDRSLTYLHYIRVIHQKDSFGEREKISLIEAALVYLWRVASRRCTFKVATAANAVWFCLCWLPLLSLESMQGCVVKQLPK